MKVVGIDIAKHHFDLHLLPEGTTARYTNNAQGIRQCRLFLAQVQPERIVLEATGGYETGPGRRTPDRRLARDRRQSSTRAGLRPVHRPDRQDRPDRRQDHRRVRHEPPRRSSESCPDAQTRQRKACMARRDQLVDMHVAERNRLEHAVDPLVTPRAIRQILRVIEKQIASDRRQARRARSPPTSKLQRQVEIIDSVPGSRADHRRHAGDPVARTGTSQSSARSPRWSAWPPSTATAANSAANA